jgi:PAS domain S-box-containing protein
LHQCDHAVQFYRDTKQLAESVASFISDGFAEKKRGLIIAETAHLKAIKEAINKTGDKFEVRRKRGEIVCFDAAELLEKFMVDGLPDECRFLEIFGDEIARLTRDGRGLCAFGEMVALLSAEGNYDGALQLEHMWNRLQKKFSITLFCAYPLAQFEGSTRTKPFLEVCEAHSKVISLYPREESEDAYSRRLALLEQRAASLEMEIRERKKKEAELREREEELRTFVENASVGLHWVRADGTIQWANRAEMELLGYEPREYIGKHIAEVYADKPVIEDILHRLKNGEQLKDFEVRLRCKNGTIKHVLVDSCGLWKNGKFVHTQCFTRDITEKKRSEESLRRVVALMPAGVYSCDAEGRITFYNRHAVELWGHEPQLGEMCQKFCACHRVFLPDGTFVPPEQTPMAHAIREGLSFRDVEAVVERPDGSRFVASVTIDPIRDSTGALVGAINVFQDITQRKAEQDAVRRLAAIVQSSDDAIIGERLDGTITSWNQGAERLYGYSAEEIIGKSISTLIPEERAHEISRLMAGERIEHFETLRRHKDGRLLDVSLTISAIRDAKGQLIGTSKIARDITRRKRMDEELRQSRERLEAIIETSPECIKIVTAEGTLVSMNKAGLAMLEVDRLDAAIGKNIFDVISPETRAAFERMHEKVCAGEKQQLEFEIIGLKGTRRWMETQAVPIRDPQTGAYLHFGVTRDITHRKKAEEALKQSEASFRQLADSMPQIVWASEPDGTLNYYNRQWYELTGAPRGKIGDESWLPVLHPDDRQRCLDVWKASVKAGKTYEIEYRFKLPRRNEYRWFLGRALPVRDDSGAITRWFGTCTDIDDQKRAEERLEQAVKERTASLQDAIAQMEEFSYSISHDLRGPLRAMQGYCHILLEEVSAQLDEQHCVYLKRISKSAERLDRLVQDVLSYTRISRSETPATRIDLNQLVEEVIRSYIGNDRPDSEIVIQRPLHAVAGHEPSLVQCMSNLIANALKFSRNGESPRIQIRTERVADKIRIWVEDNGIGIRADHIHKIFGMFERTPEASNFEGTGMGLAIVKKAVQRMKGEIGVESQPGCGSRFWIELPACE